MQSKQMDSLEANGFPKSIWKDTFEDNRTKKIFNKQDPKKYAINSYNQIGTCLSQHATTEQDNFQYQF